MTTFDRIKNLANKQGKSLQKVAGDLGFSPSYFYNLKSKKSPSAEHLAKVADYFHVSVDYLLGREEIEHPQFSTELLDAIDNAEGYSGKPIDEHDKEIVKSLLAAYFAGRDK